MRNFKLLFCVIFCIVIFFSCDQEQNADLTFESTPVADYDHEVITQWNDVLLSVEKNAEGYRSGPATRTLAYLSLSAYEIAIQGMPEYNTFSGKWQGFDMPKIDDQKEYCWPLAVNASYEYLMPRFFGKATVAELDLIAETAKKIKEKYGETVSSKVLDNSQIWGKKIAEVVWNYSMTDPIGHDYYLNPSQGYDWQQYYKKEGDWKPEVLGTQAVGGIWGKARTFSLKDEGKLCRKPETYIGNMTGPGSVIYMQNLELMAQTDPTELSNKIATFWSDDFLHFTFSYGLRYLSIGNQMLKQKKSTLEQALFMNALLGVSLNDAGVACFHSKYFYNKEHPLTYIKREIDPSWTTALANPINGDRNLTPSYPSFPSGHATFASAGAEALSIVFGYSNKFTDLTHLDRPEIYVDNSYYSFYESALEAAWSRVALGVNLRMDIEEGVRFGTEIGRSAGKLPWKKK